jgi:acyl-coenzyme A synthetase/AMP-(fatty) acid ligase/thioesterase domain-containing protein
MIVGRDVASAVAVNAALRAGVGFVPIDASWPAGAVERLLVRLDGPRVAVVTSASRSAVLPVGVECVPVPDEPGLAIDPVAVDPDATAMVTFTSGSSGEPKGVVSPWWAFDAYRAPMTAAAPAGAPDYRAVSLLPPSFAAGVVSLLRPSVGTAVSIIDPSAHDPLSLLETFDRERLNLVVLVPSLVSAVMSRWPTGRRLDAVDTVLVFGEPLDWPMVRTLRTILPEDAVIVNSYGATETIVIVAECRVTARAPLGVGRVPLGRPLVDGRIRLEPLSPDPGAPTEIVVVGGVSPGYWRDEALTAVTFGRDPDDTPFWRSGDLARFDEAGDLHFVGRRDNVVKINGRLVEPSEPEAVLGAIPGVRRAVVLVQEGPRGPRLVAHLELADDATVTPVGVRAELARRVAPYLVPAVLVRHDRLPLTENGKIDRRALGAAPPQPWRTTAASRPSQAFEVAVIAAAADVLGHGSIGPEDDLWDLGLDSLGATELLSTLQDFGWPAMPEAVLLEHRTPSAINGLRTGFVPTGSDIWLNPDADGALVVCVLPPAADALTFRGLAQAIGPDHPVAIVRQADPRAASRPHRSVEQIAGALLARLAGEFSGRRDVWFVGYSASGVVAHELAVQLAPSPVVARVVLLDAPAGRWTDGDPAADEDLRRRLRRAARQAWLRALPPATLPVRERSFALFEIGSAAAVTYAPRPSSHATVLFRAAEGGWGSLADAWRRAVPDLAVVDLACDHVEILGLPHIGRVAEAIRDHGYAGGD